MHIDRVGQISYLLVIESTYGDRLHENRRTRRQRLEKVLERALSNQGTILIPAFGICRTQDVVVY